MMSEENDSDIEETTPPEVPTEEVPVPEDENEYEDAVAETEVLEPEDDDDEHDNVEISPDEVEAVESTQTEQNLGQKIKTGAAKFGAATATGAVKAFQIKAWKKSGFLSWMGRGLGTTCARTWHLRAPGYNAYATLEHDCLTGRRQLSINKEVVYQKTVFPDRSFEIWFDINGISGKIAAENDYKDNALYYSCIFNNRPLQTTIFGKEGKEEVASAPAADADADDEPSVPISISIPRTEMRQDGRLQVAFYKIEVKRGDDKIEVGKRFSEFIDFYEKIWASYASHEILKTIPKPPKKTWKLFKKHDDEAFIETRRAGLEAFMQGLLKVPSISSNLFFLDFLDLHKAKSSDDTITILDVIRTTLKFEAQRPASDLWNTISDWKNASWKGKGGEDAEVNEDETVRTFTLSEPWGEVSEKKVSSKNVGEGGRLEYTMTKSAWPLRHFSCIVDVTHKQKMVNAKMRVQLKYVCNPGENVALLTEQLNTSVSDQFHALQVTS